MPYSKELSILQKSKLLREKKIHPSYLMDYASNDYLGLACDSQLLEKAILRLKTSPIHAPISSMAINGYHPLHLDLESLLVSYFGFESCTLFGSGFLANLALFDTLVRKHDLIFIDELYHASGQYPAKLLKDQAIFFSHNDPNDLRQKLKSHLAKGRILIAIEGVYSMDGDIASKEFALIAQEYNALLIIDEAHSSGVIGDNLKGYLDYHHLPISQNIIKMGTLSKAYGSYGAFVLGAKSVTDFLFSKAKSSIYTTAPSLFDIALAHENLLYIQQHTQEISTKLQEQRESLQPLCLPQSQLAILPFVKQEQMMEISQLLLDHHFLVGSIRKPTSNTPRLRISLNLKNSKMQTQKLCKILQNALKSIGYKC
ncbi:aminotransferase class I/II-fold pyridoxal phosphate-dependent enzyme [Helicobacter pametensis]|uniref:aminotransferase class I/II-fold pyridoxal phosphate-dependent enzyme n=1 Tax=Helicobacter pametensis TaxID=95149 RepID=UPI0004893CC0|nr:pyridoxal phosphate-dependent aminotransferase family protein [Helicobacter pametensis]